VWLVASPAELVIFDALCAGPRDLEVIRRLMEHRRVLHNVAKPYSTGSCSLASIQSGLNYHAVRGPMEIRGRSDNLHYGIVLQACSRSGASRGQTKLFQ